MKATKANQKIKELERRISVLEGMPWSARPRSNVLSTLERIHGVWSGKPKTRRDLNRVRKQLWGRLA